MNTTEIFGLKILNITVTKAIQTIHNMVIRNEHKKIFFINADCINQAVTNSKYKSVLNKNQYLFSDGTGVRMASKLLNHQDIDNVNGTDLFPMICQMALQDDRSIYLLGAKPGVARKVKNNIERSFPGIKIAGYNNGYFDREKDSMKVVNEINQSNADILFVAFGVPIQEIWIDKYFDKINCSVMLGVGGLFDYFSGNIKRAPLWMRQAGIEWIFRLMLEPVRLGKRYIVGNPLFILRLAKEKVKKLVTGFAMRLRPHMN